MKAYLVGCLLLLLASDALAQCPFQSAGRSLLSNLGHTGAAVARRLKQCDVTAAESLDVEAVKVLLAL